jgi:hypothetical protein
VSTLDLLLPELRRVAPLDTQRRLARWLARGDREPNAKPGREIALRETFEFTGIHFPYAALTRSLIWSDAADAVWINADPASVIADAVTVRMLACGNLGLTVEESNELAKPLKLLFGDAGFPLEVSPTGRWQLRCPKTSRLPVFSPPSAVLGDDMARHLPTGDNERQWRYLLNEAQVILHNHALNTARVQRGLPAVNSVWFWGGGALPDWVRTPLTRVISGDEPVVALARLAKVPHIDTSWSAQDPANRSDSILLDLGSANDAQSLDVHLADIDRALKQRFVTSLRIASADGTRAVYKPGHAWRWWRTVKPLPAQ